MGTPDWEAMEEGLEESVLVTRQGGRYQAAPEALHSRPQHKPRTRTAQSKAKAAAKAKPKAGSKGSAKRTSKYRRQAGPFRHTPPQESDLQKARLEEVLRPSSSGQRAREITQFPATSQTFLPWWSRNSSSAQ